MLLLLQALVGLGLASLIILHVGKILLVGSEQSPKCGYEMYHQSVDRAENYIETSLSGCYRSRADHSVTPPRKHDNATLEVLTVDTGEDETSVCSPHGREVGLCLEPALQEHHHGDVTPPPADCYAKVNPEVRNETPAMRFSFDPPTSAELMSGHTEIEMQNYELRDTISGVATSGNLGGVGVENAAEDDVSGRIIYSTIDTDGDGVISQAEFVAAGGDLSDFTRMDNDGDGMLDYEEVDMETMKQIGGQNN